MSDKTRLWVVALIALTAGGFGGYYFTNQHSLAEEVKSHHNVLCEAQVIAGGGNRNKLSVIERYASKGDCDQFIEYKNIPDDASIFGWSF